MDHRAFHACWYDDTYVSIVLESARSWEELVCFLTEKTYKPIAFYHPFMLFAGEGALKLLHKQGFETFEHLYDERYDKTNDLLEKIKIIKSNIDNSRWEPYNQYTLEKLQHNHDRFFNKKLIEKGIVKDIIEPIYNIIETK